MRSVCDQSQAESPGEAWSLVFALPHRAQLLMQRPSASCSHVHTAWCSAVFHLKNCNLSFSLKLTQFLSTEELLCFWGSFSFKRSVVRTGCAPRTGHPTQCTCEGSSPQMPAGLDYTGHMSVHFYPADPFVRCHVVYSGVRESKIELVKNITTVLHLRNVCGTQSLPLRCLRKSCQGVCNVCCDVGLLEWDRQVSSLNKQAVSTSKLACFGVAVEVSVRSRSPCN